LIVPKTAIIVSYGKRGLHKLDLREKISGFTKEQLLHMASTLHIAIKPETLFELGGIPITNTLFTSFLVTIFIALFALWANRQLKSVNKPTSTQAFVEMLIEALYGIVHDIAGKRAWTFMPLITGFMFFILINNWAEQLPGFHTIVYTGKSEVKLVQVPSWMQVPAAYAAETHPTEVEEHAAAVEGEEVLHITEESHDVAGDEHASAQEHPEDEHAAGVALFRGAHADVNMTLALALISVGATQYFGLAFAKLGYIKKFINFSSPINTFIGLLELLGEFSKILSFSFRLFGNIFAGEVLIAVISFLIPVVVPMPFIGFEIFVGALQAYVFAMLSTVFFTMAADHHDH
jgi:F-type H+-transporting ATPase subunit a